MSEPYGTLPGFGADAPTPAAPTTDAAPAAAPDPVAAPAAADTSASPAAGTTAPADTAPADGFDRARVMRLLERLERDVATVEAAMVHVEAGEHEAYAAAVASLEPRLAD